MKVQMHSIKFDADQKLIDFIQKKVDKLETFFDRIVDGEVYMRLDKNDNQGNKIIEILLNLPGSQLFAKEVAPTFEEATDRATDALRRQLKKHKEKQIARQI
ncbi:ribosome hibernation-promoting factor, HPF/YfiA family [Aureibacter tunicatorum]|uniref:Sigma-54 modulation protein n=1 Tax=Aureibacter tunicatorum TaxID=866807 RepID=A0AAE3XLC1_9BACT|nr:ribosome-associated translation inhibitor RaiA [Aureibacter tunicatorum]MDR6238094.1 putative sigma-54 modulation protein [Aureibacter tunicatorum]BDD03127.1 ribosomal subunit interface protein [Aureibacter tunicatorum]